jgi:hypothetical protein
VVQPEYADDQAGKPGVSRAALVLVGFALAVAASLVIGDLTDPGIIGAETTTTSTIAEVRPPLDPEDFSVAAIETGRALAWEPVLETQEVWPVGLVEHESRLYLFATHLAASSRPTRGGGLTGWVSENGAEWKSLGELIDRRYVVNNVVSTSKGLVALGADPDGGAVIWIAESGLEWRPNELPVSASSPPTQTWLSHAAATDDRLVVMGNDRIDPGAILQHYLPEEIPGEHLDRYGVGWLGPPGAIVVYGPLGLIADVFTAEDLGVTAEELSRILGTNDEPSTHVWTTGDGVAWEETVLEVWGVQDLFPGSDGSLSAAVWGHSGVELWSSGDGLAWEAVMGPTSVEAVSRWGDSLVGIRYMGAVPDLVLSADGIRWESMGLEDLFPEPREVPGLQWNFDSLATGEAGVALVAVGWEEPMGSWVYEPVVIAKDGHTLTVDEASGSLVLDHGVEEHRWTIHSPSTQDDIAVDLAAETITITHPDSREVLLTLSFEEIDRASALRSATQQTDGAHKAFVFTADGETWAVEDFSKKVGQGRRVTDVDVTESAVLVLTGSDRWWGPFPYRTDSEVQVWRGTPSP